jgi:hypothetical protein
VTDPFLAYIYDGRLHVQHDGGAEILESPFALSLRDRAVQIHNRNAWKLQGRGGQALTRAMRAPAERDPSEFRIAITSVTRGHSAGELLYTLETDEISGIFTRNSEGIEKRLFHTADFRASHPDPHPDGSEITVSVNHHNQMANIAVMKADGSDLIEVTDGDSLDQAPRWVPGAGRRLVFQSAGLARDRGGRFSGYGPFSVQQLDLGSGEISCLAQDARFDFLSPRVTADGTLYYIRKPRNNAPQAVNPGVTLQDAVLVPFRILWAIARLIEIIVQGLTGQPLFTPKAAAAKAEKTPSSWLLMRQTPESGEVETIAANVMAFDLAGDGSLIYSNGVDAYRTPANSNRPTRILAGTNLDLIAAL